MSDASLSTLESNLCDRCAGFDVRALFVTADVTRKKWPGHRVPSDEAILCGVFRFYQLQPNLLALRASASQCNLCSAIWEQVIRLRHGVELNDEELKAGTSAEPVYLDLDDWEEGRSRAPHVIATQYPVSDPEDSDSAALGRRLAYFDVCSTPGKEPSDHQTLLGTVQAVSAFDPECLELVRCWLQRCSDTHTLCKKTASSSELPTRVLDVMTDLDTVYLVDGKVHSGPYSALSYCWGGERELVLESATEKELRSGLDLARFPATLSDAVKVTQSLGIHYLWIDALCIFQDSREDWAREAARMSQVYSGSAITIEAASASKASEGFSKQRVSSKPYVELQWRSSSSSIETVLMRPMHDIVDIQLTDTTIFHRGWTLQERLLAPRTLSFGRQQMSFECASASVDEAGTLAALPRDETEHYLRKDSMNRIRCEQGFFQSSLRWIARSVGIPRTINTPFGDFCTQGSLQVSRGTYGSYFDYWKVIVHQFSSREFTDPSDRLPALSGLAREIQRVTKDRYCAGLWSSDLVSSLAWTVGSVFNAQGRYGEDRSFVIPSRKIKDWPDGIQSAKYIAPSWSWASVAGQVSFLTLDGLPHSFAPLAKILGVSLQPRYTDPFGLLLKGHLDIEGRLLRLPSFMTPCEKDYPWRILHDYLRCAYVWMTFNDSAQEPYQHHRSHESQEFAMLQLLTWRTSGRNEWESSLCCLLLETCGDGTWRRLCLTHTDIINRELRSNSDLLNLMEQSIKMVGTSNQIYDQSHTMGLVLEQIEAAPWKTERFRLS